MKIPCQTCGGKGHLLIGVDGAIANKLEKMLRGKLDKIREIVEKWPETLMGETNYTLQETIRNEAETTVTDVILIMLSEEGETK